MYEDVDTEETKIYQKFRDGVYILKTSKISSTLSTTLNQ